MEHPRVIRALRLVERISDAGWPQFFDDTVHDLRPNCDDKLFVGAGRSHASTPFIEERPPGRCWKAHNPVDKVQLKEMRLPSGRPPPRLVRGGRHQSFVP